MASTSYSDELFDLGDLYFETVGSDRSVGGNSITALSEGHDGFLWIGTQYGLTRFDGNRFRRFRHRSSDSQSLVGDFVTSIWREPSGRLWVGTFSDGVSVFDPETEEFVNYRHDPSNPNSLAHNRIEAIVGDAHGDGIWFGTDDGLDYLNLKSGHIRHFRHDESDGRSLSDNQVRALLLDSAGALWVGTGSGLDRRHADKPGFAHIRGDLKSEVGEVVTLFEDHLGGVWIGTRLKGAARIDSQTDDLRWVYPRNGQAVGFGHPWVRAIAQVGRDEIWLGTYGGGITVVDTHSGTLRRRVVHSAAVGSSINSDHIGSLWVGQDGLVWIGTWGGGLNRFNPLNSAFRALHHSQRPGSLSYGDVSAIRELASGEIWVGTRGNGIDVLDPNLGVTGGFRPDPSRVDALGDGTINAIVETADGNIYVGTRQAGLHRYSRASESFRRFERADGLIHDHIRTMVASPDWKLWIGTDAGLNSFDPITEGFGTFGYFEQPDEIFDETVLALAQTHDGSLWVGTANGLFVLPPGSNALRRIRKQPEGLSHNLIFGLMVDHLDHLWVATKQGLDRLERWDGIDAQFESVSARVGRPGEALGENIMQDMAGRVWSHRTMVDPGTWRAYEFGEADGLHIDAWVGSFEQTKSGTLLFGGPEGLVMVRPERFVGWTYEPPVRVSELLINGVRHSGGVSNLVLDAKDRGFSLEFTALDYSAPDTIRYTYRLDGYDPEWIYTSADNRRATYTNLDPGHYTFHVRATNRVGKWSPHELSIPVRQLPHWYQTAWFRVSAGIGVFLMLFLTYQVRLRRVRASERRLQAEVAARTSNIGMLGIVGREITESLKLTEVVGTVYARVTELFAADAFSIGVYDRQTETIRFPMAIEKGVALPAYSYAMAESDRLAVWCVHYGQEVHTRRASDILRYVGTILDPVGGINMETVLYLPLRLSGETVGCMTVQREAPGGFDEVQLDMLRTIAAYAAVAVDHAFTHEAVERASRTDSLTQLPNRRAFMELSKHQASVAARSAAPLSFAIGDIDKFKLFNDQYGHDGGDFVLQEVAKLFREHLREQDVVARWGGEEFVFMLPNTTPADARHAVDKVRGALAERRFQFDGHSFAITSTFGVAAYHQGGGLEAALKAADEALYEGKEGGRNRVVLAAS